MKPLTLYCHILRGKLHWYPHQGVLYRAWIDKLSEGDTVEITLKKQGRKKTNPQLGYWYSVVIPHTVQGLLDAGHHTIFDISIGGHSVGVETNTDTVDLLLKTLYRAHKQLDKVPEKRYMSTEEMSDLIDFALVWAAENLSVFIPPPKEQ